MKPPQKEIRTQAAAWLAEDLGRGDITSLATVPEGVRARAAIRAKQELVAAGLPYAREVFLALDRRIRFTTRVRDGDLVGPGTVLAAVDGRARVLLAGERTALNVLQHLSGVATTARRYVEAVRGTGAVILDTRKTVPGLRRAEKYAVACGGATNHRMGLYDRVLIKDNHIESAGGIAAAVRAARSRGIPPRRIQVEVSTLEELREALAAGVHRIMLDNMPLSRLRRAVQIAGGRAVLEASGDVNLRRVRAIAETGVDRISVGALTHSAPAVDIHLTIGKRRDG